MHPNCVDPCPACDAEAGAPTDGEIFQIVASRLPGKMLLSEFQILVPAFKQAYLAGLERGNPNEAGENR